MMCDICLSDPCAGWAACRERRAPAVDPQLAETPKPTPDVEPSPPAADVGPIAEETPVVEAGTVVPKHPPFYEAEHIALGEFVRRHGLFPTRDLGQLLAKRLKNSKRPRPWMADDFDWVYQDEVGVVELASNVALAAYLEEHLDDDGDDPTVTEEQRRRFTDAFSQRLQSPGAYTLETFIADQGLSSAQAKPLILAVLRVPKELLVPQHWICWKKIWDENAKKWKKPPFSAKDGSAIGAIEKYKDHFVSYDEARAYADTHKDVDGISYVFREGEEIVGIDVDGCRDAATGAIDPAVQNWLNNWLSSYAEISPSGTGIHVIGRGKIPKAVSGVQFPKAAQGVTVEMYQQARHFCFTCQRLDGHHQITDCQIGIHKLLAAIGGATASETPPQDGRPMTRAAICKMYENQLQKFRALVKPGDPQNKTLNDTALMAARVFLSKVYEGKTEKQFDAEVKAIANSTPHCPGIDATFKSGWDTGIKKGPHNVVDEGTSWLIHTRGDEVTLRRVNWLWRPVLVNCEINVFAGMPDTGKGTISNDLAARITSHRPFPGEDGFTLGDRDEVLLLSGEETYETTTLPRIKAAGGNLARMHIIKGVQIKTKDTELERFVALDADIEKLRVFLRQNPRIVLVVIDPVDVYFGQGKKNDREDVTKIYGNLKRLAEEFNLAILLIDHINKDGEKAALHRISGAGAAGARPRSAWLFARDREDKNIRHIACLKMNLVPEEEKRSWRFKFRDTSLEIEGEPQSVATVEWLGRSDQDADGLLAKRDPEETEKTRAKAFLHKALMKGSRLAKEIFAEAEVANISEKTLRRAKEALQIRSFQEKGHGPWFWKLPEAKPVQLDLPAESDPAPF